ncbi:unnamed protein product, partial [Iphiclides podalirius]
MNEASSPVSKVLMIHAPPPLYPHPPPQKLVGPQAVREKVETAMLRPRIMICRRDPRAGIENRFRQHIGRFAGWMFRCDITENTARFTANKRAWGRAPRRQFASTEQRSVDLLFNVLREREYSYGAGAKGKQKNVFSGGPIEFGSLA